MNTLAKREKSRHAGGLLVYSIIMVFLLIFAGIWWSTQYIAALLDYQDRLGSPLFSIFGYRIYEPFSYFVWLFNFNAYAPHEFDLAMVPMGVAAFLAVASAIIMSLWRSRLVVAATTYGTARWATKKDIKNSGLLAGLTGVVFGMTENGQYLTHDGPEHIKVIAPSRSGKGVGVVVPTLLTWKHSVVVNDIKRELWRDTAGWRSTFSNCIAFDPSSDTTARFNPLLEVRMGRKEVKDVQNIAAIIVENNGDEKSSYWTKEADAFLVAAILHVLYTEPNKSLEGVYHFINHPDRTFDATLQIMLNTEHYGAGKGKHPVIVMGARAMLNKAPNERSGVHGSAKSFLTLYIDPIVADATRDSDFTIEDLQNAKYPVSLYIIYPPSDMKRLRPLYRLMMTQILSRLTEELSPNIKHRLLVLMDEFPSLGKLQFFEEALGYAAGYGIKAMMISQNYNQIIQQYGPHNSIVDSCHIRVYFAPNTEDAAETISKELGTKTEIHQQRNYGGHRLSPWLGHLMVSDQETSRRLLTASEVMELSDTVEIVRVAGLPPIYGQKIRYYADQNFIPKSKTQRPAPVLTNARPYPYRCAARINSWLTLPAQSNIIEPAIKGIFDGVIEGNNESLPQAENKHGGNALSVSISATDATAANTPNSSIRTAVLEDSITHSDLDLETL